ncbi:tRNA 2-thiouridine(34) synthase MnmA [Alkalilimnicola sp. S0819]|uniref:tRNA 2-thiouridine(34) synthase MnmA n=1 Tax=Alkalilimnicola sp. S0819 TaxID=2613922 RepID=UPI0012623475|nr:tRNA 2-thiouridine(34) synthase MnmA [Alkalilimnicola sp. S0819]KAB7627508.1 tRNA 2-thiouridine(34) synthase MnmA [Alkalilimnicola sp. S0819]MPQ15662.1 tRNA 2-thiouridine(34) synthase MnmA [Alkalilimnicola sp. S0819]
MNQKRTRVIVGLSGGVDSSVAALRLQEQGHEVHGLFMKNWEDDDTATECTAEQDLADARQVAERLGIPLHQANFAAEYRQQVFDHCLEEFRRGRTPNPDILCNQQIKFRAFLDYALRLGADYVATGHYAGVDGDADSGFRLLRAVDQAKDQTYFLYTLGQRALAHSLFPLAGLHKREVREIAEGAGLDTFDKKDSTGICFIGERDFREFLGRYLPREPGEIVTDTGHTVGRHHGLAFYTLGQRRGLAIGGRAGHTEGAWYVIDKERESNRLLVAQDHAHPRLLSRALRATDLRWVAGGPPATRFRCTAKTRYRQADQPCEAKVRDDGTLELRFDEPQRAVTPGQSVVLYQDEACLGGGIIDWRDRLDLAP